MRPEDKGLTPVHKRFFFCDKRPKSQIVVNVVSTEIKDEEGKVYDDIGGGLIRVSNNRERDRTKGVPLSHYGGVLREKREQVWTN